MDRFTESTRLLAERVRETIQPIGNSMAELARRLGSMPWHFDMDTGEVEYRDDPDLTEEENRQIQDAGCAFTVRVVNMPVPGTYGPDRWHTVRRPQPVYRSVTTNFDLRQQFPSSWNKKFEYNPVPSYTGFNSVTKRSRPSLKDKHPILPDDSFNRLRDYLDDAHLNFTKNRRPRMATTYNQMYRSLVQVIELTDGGKPEFLKEVADTALLTIKESGNTMYSKTTLQYREATVRDTPFYKGLVQAYYRLLFIRRFMHAQGNTRFQIPKHVKQLFADAVRNITNAK